MRTADAVTHVASRLRAAGIDDARREARIILAASLDTDAAGLLSVDHVPAAAFEDMIARRERREPLAYILGRREFWGLDFEVSPATLIPRADSETLIEAALAALPDKSAVQSVLDLGTGTGCLLLAALSEYTAAFGIGIDIAPEAAALASRNAVKLGLSGRAAFIAGSWADALGGRFDLILSNPPYIPGRDIAALMAEVADFEPRLALDGGADGLDAYRLIIAALPWLLAANGVAVLELGVGQDHTVAILAESAGFAAILRKDLAGLPRAIALTRFK